MTVNLQIATVSAPATPTASDHSLQAALGDDIVCSGEDAEVGATFATLQGLLTTLQRGFDHPAETPFGTFAETIQALRAELAAIADHMDGLADGAGPVPTSAASARATA